MIDQTIIWPVIIAIGIGSFALRFMFLGPVGRTTMPEWVQRHLRYTAVAALPALLVQMLKNPTTIMPDSRGVALIAILLTLLVCYFTKNLIIATLAGGAVFILCTQVF